MNNVGLQLTNTGRALRAETGAEHIYVFILSHHVDHLQIHRVPRNPGTPPEYWGLRLDKWPETRRGSEQDIVELNKKIRSRLPEEAL